MSNPDTKEETVQTVKEKEKTNNLSPKTKLIMIIAIGVVVLLLAVTLLPKLLNPNAGKVTTISESSLQEVIEINDLSTLEYTYNAITKAYVEDSEKLKYHVAYEGIVIAGIDITKVKISVDEENKLISITIPPAEIQSVDVAMESLDFIFEKASYETENITQEAYHICLTDLEARAAKEPTLLNMARENAIAAMSGLITPWVEQIDESYTIEIK